MDISCRSSTSGSNTSRPQPPTQASWFRSNKTLSPARGRSRSPCRSPSPSIVRLKLEDAAANYGGFQKAGADVHIVTTDTHHAPASGPKPHRRPARSGVSAVCISPHDRQMQKATHSESSDAVMLDCDLKARLQVHLQNLIRPVELAATLGESDKSREPPIRRLARSCLSAAFRKPKNQPVRNDRPWRRPVAGITSVEHVMCAIRHDCPARGLRIHCHASRNLDRDVMKGSS